MLSFALLCVVAIVAIIYPSFIQCAAKPNIVVVLIDDWGWNNWGIHASANSNSAEVRTPNLDALARDGIILDRHYTPRMCGPSRDTFFTGRNSIHNTAANGAMGQYNISDPISGYEGSPLKMTFISEKLRNVGYDTGMFGKWDAGQATPQHFPINRGFNHALTYQSFTIDPWVYRAGPPFTPEFGWCVGENYLDLWENDKPAYRFKPEENCQQQLPGCVYSDELFANEAISYISDHQANRADDPLFLVYSSHAIHTPLYPSQQYTADFNAFIDNDYRANYSAMVNEADTIVQTIVQELKDQNMWENTFMYVASDNGGPIYMNRVNTFGGPPATGGANNYPLRGGKFSQFEGGIRTNAFVTGGAIPKAKRGTVETGFIANEDWYATFCAIAGCDPVDVLAEEYNLPAVDGINVYPLLMGETSVSPRKELYFSGLTPFPGLSDGTPLVQTVIDDEGYKLIIGTVSDSIHTGPFWPNNDDSYDQSTNFTYCGNDDGNTAMPPVFDETTQSYPGACLYNIFSDPYEYNNIASANPDIVSRLSKRMLALEQTVFDPKRGLPTELSCLATKVSWGGFQGPMIFDSIEGSFSTASSSCDDRGPHLSYVGAVLITVACAIVVAAAASLGLWYWMSQAAAAQTTNGMKKSDDPTSQSTPYSKAAVVEEGGDRNDSVVATVAQAPCDDVI